MISIDSRDDPEKRVHEPMNASGSRRAELACRRNLKIDQQPIALLGAA
jgi:hypothetical protein